MYKNFPNKQEKKKEKYDHKYLAQTHNSSLERRMSEG